MGSVVKVLGHVHSWQRRGDEPLYQMYSTRSLYNAAYLPRLQRESSILELLLHLPSAEPASVIRR